MKCYWDRRTDRLFGVICMLMVMLWFAREICEKARATSPVNTRNNPNAFFAWTTNSSVHYTFTYDPHKADVWLFETAGQGTVNIPTNSPSQKPKWVWKN